MPSASDFEQLIVANREAEKVDPATVSIENGQSKLSVRLRGGFITLCQVTAPKTGNTTDLLFAEEDLTVPKLLATHSMSPAGPFEGPGGQHGFPRWADYIVSEQSNETGRLTLEARQKDETVMFQKSFELAEHALLTRSTVYNQTDGTLRTSLAEHYYYPLPNDETDGLTINGMTVDELLGQGTLSQIMAGDSAFWEEWPGKADIRFPSGYTMRLEASVSPDTNLGMLLWHKPGSGTICFEPTAGYKHGRMNTCLCLEPGEQATLTSSLTLI